ncbi:hypothetical protein HUG10_18310 [Halorarum halophilum]|uniref:Uncharacterized protein n=1 Tax=Halorarum halophilum TaxID=2743090 RepID=A0A7D5GNI1_9EURY|nr:hypothetical protein [Halobaculum halophilum]QLG29364.1 hypothetical protein HUG10_18310 [Halobaculum halophilum]
MPPSTETARLALALLVVASLVAVPAAVDARAPAQAVCGVCTDQLDDAAADRGVALERASSDLTIRVAENGSTRWTAHVTLAQGAEALRNDSLREAVVADARRRTVADPGAVASRVDDDTLVVSYRVDGATERETGVLLFTAFHENGPVVPFAMGGPGPIYLGADAVALHAPEGRAVAGDDGRADGSTGDVHWTGAETGIDRSTVVAFVPENAAFPGVRAGVARLLFRL